MKKDKQVLFIVPYPCGYAPSQRFRVEQYLPLLESEGIGYAMRPFFDKEGWDILYKGGAFLKKAVSVVKGFFKRLVTVFFEAPKYKVIFIHREAAPIGPPFFEWWLTRVLKKKVVYDFDDAIWVPAVSGENKSVAWLKAFWKVSYICSRASVVAAGNDYLAAFATSHHAREVKVLPTVVDTRSRYVVPPEARAPAAGELAIGWTGSHSTTRYLDAIVPVIQRLQEEFSFTFIVIADKDPDLPLRHYTFIPWRAGTEIEDLLRIQIGVMPLTNDPWSEGKCGFKLIQFMALGIPCVASPVGVNKKIIDDGRTGYLADTPEEWYQAIKDLMPEEKRKDMRPGIISCIEDRYSLQSQQEKFLHLVD